MEKVVCAGVLRKVGGHRTNHAQVIHALGDVQAFWLLGYIGGHTNMHIAFLFVSGIIFISGLAWLIGVKYLPADTAAVETARID